ncbi:DUF115 domain-containing protein [bacterium]|nr:DUF115 domain-containing protein [bacterium]
MRSPYRSGQLRLLPLRESNRKKTLRSFLSLCHQNKSIIKEICTCGQCDDTPPSFSEYRDLGKDIVPNILSNLLHVEEVIDGRDLGEIFAGEEVIVCGSGISLDSAIEQILQMRHRPFIIATGSSIHKLLDNGIIPDFFAAVDPLPVGDAYERLEHLSIPLLYQNRTARDLVYQHSGPKIYMGSSKGWQIEESMMGEMERDNFFFDAGYNAGNFGAHVALALGCKKLILVGMCGVAKEGEEGILEKENLRTRADLLYGMDFFQVLSENFPEAEVEQLSDGLSFARATKIEKVNCTPKKKELVLPPTEKWDSEQAKRVIDRYFDHSMKESLEEFLQQPRKSVSEKEALAACLLAELSLEPLYLHFLQPLWEVWKYLIPNAEDTFAKLTFFYSVLKNLSEEKTGFEAEAFFLFGKREGRSKENDDAGVLRTEAYFYRGKRERSVKKYKEDGSLLSMQEMKKGLRHGAYQVFSGVHKVREGTFVEGAPHGVQRCFYDGFVIDEVEFNLGKKCGIHKKFSLDGTLRAKVIYQEGGELFDTYYFDSKGQKNYEAVWKGSLFLEKKFEGGKVIHSREGKLVAGKVVMEDR